MRDIYALYDKWSTKYDNLPDDKYKRVLAECILQFLIDINSLNANAKKLKNYD